MRSERERDLLRGAEEGLRRGRTAEAIRAYESLLDLYAHRGADQKSAAILRTLIRIEPNEARWLEQLAEVETRLGHPREAAEWWERVARVHAASGRAELAERAWRRVREEPTGAFPPPTPDGPGGQGRTGLPIARGRPADPDPVREARIGFLDTDPSGTTDAPTAPEHSEIDLDGPDPIDLGSLSGSLEEPPLPSESQRTDETAAFHQPTLALDPQPLEPPTYELSDDEALDDPPSGHEDATVPVSAGAVRAALALARRLEPETERLETTDLDEEPDALEGDKTLWDPQFLSAHSPKRLGRGLGAGVGRRRGGDPGSSD